MPCIVSIRMVPEHDNPLIWQAIEAEPLLQVTSAEQREKLVRLVELLVRRQNEVNLTAIKDPVLIVRYHLADSLALFAAVNEWLPPHIKSAADIGTGAGFPLLPMAIMQPQVDWLGIESVGKKVRFIEEAAAELDLGNVDGVAERAEVIGRAVNGRGAFDLVTSRAVGPVSSLLEVSFPLLKQGGRIAMFKTEAAMAEWRANRGVIEQLGGRALEPYRYQLEGDNQDRLLFIAEKISETPGKYPRAVGLPFNKPLVAPPGASR